MFITEKEAKLRLCPLSMSNCGRVETVDGGSLERVTVSDHYPATCQASKCMAWLSASPYDKLEPSGRCGLI